LALERPSLPVQPVQLVPPSLQVELLALA